MDNGVLNYGRVTGVLGDPAIEVDVGANADDILFEREARKYVHIRKAGV